MVGGIRIQNLLRASPEVPRPPPGPWLITQVPAYRDRRGVCRVAPEILCRRPRALIPLRVVSPVPSGHPVGWPGTGAPYTRSLLRSRRIRPLYTSLVYCLVAYVLCIRLSYTFFCPPFVIRLLSPHTFRSRHRCHLHLTAYVLCTRYTLYLATLRCCRIRPLYTFLVYCLVAYVLCLRLSYTFSAPVPYVSTLPIAGILQLCHTSGIWSGHRP